jgi:hypothetical protein
MPWVPPAPAQVQVPPPKFNGPRPGADFNPDHPPAGFAPPSFEDSPERGIAMALEKATAQMERKGPQKE